MTMKMFRWPRRNEKAVKREGAVMVYRGPKGMLLEADNKKRGAGRWFRSSSVLLREAWRGAPVQGKRRKDFRLAPGRRVSLAAKKTSKSSTGSAAGPATILLPLSGDASPPFVEVQFTTGVSSRIPTYRAYVC